MIRRTRKGRKERDAFLDQALTEAGFPLLPARAQCQYYRQQGIQQLKPQCAMQDDTQREQEVEVPDASRAQLAE
jgi:hypothetical protein